MNFIFRFDPSVDGDPTVEGGQKFRHRTILCMPIMYSNKPNKVLGVFQLGTVHQILSPISDSESTNFWMNMYYDFFFNWQNEKKHLFWTNKKFVFFFNCSNWEKIRETNWWNYLMNSLTAVKLPIILPTSASLHQTK